MSNALTTVSASNLPSAFAGYDNLPDLNAAAQGGVQASFAVVGFRGKVWRLKHRGEEINVLDNNGEPKPVLDVVIVGVHPGVSKQYYEKKYADGDDAAPDCFSVDGITPDASAPKKQCTTCAQCPMNQFGSRMSEAGKKAKACADSKRLAVVPADDIENSTYGGPMMLRLPAMSLQNFTAYTAQLNKHGAQPFSVKTRLGFDVGAAYPQLTFKPAVDRDAAGKVVKSPYVGGEEVGQVVTLLQDPQIKRILNTAADDVKPVATQAEPDDDDGLAGGPPAQLAAPTKIDYAKATEDMQAVSAPPPPVKQPDPPAPSAPIQPPLAVEMTATASLEQPVKPAATTVVQKAPSNMEAALDSLFKM